MEKLKRKKCVARLEQIKRRLDAYSYRITGFRGLRDEDDGMAGCTPSIGRVGQCKGSPGSLKGDIVFLSRVPGLTNVNADVFRYLSSEREMTTAREAPRATREHYHLGAVTQLCGAGALSTGIPWERSSRHLHRSACGCKFRPQTTTLNHCCYQAA